MAQPRQRHRAIRKRDGTITSANYLPMSHDVWRYKKAIQSQVRGAMAGRPPWDTEVQLQIIFYCRRPQTVPKNGYIPAKDIDNYIKAVLDALNGVLYVDDRQVTRITAEKRVCGKLDDRPIDRDPPYTDRCWNEGYHVMTRGRGNVVPQRTKVRIVTLYCERDLDGRYLWTQEQITRVTGIGIQTVRKILRDALVDYAERREARRPRRC